MYTKKEADLRVGTNLDWLIERLRLNREDYARSWQIQKESADKIVLGQRGITSEKVYALFDDFAILSITLGCLLSNIFIFNSIIDAIFGTVATFIGLICIKFIKKNNFFLKMLPTILSNAIIIPFVLKFAYFENTPLFLYP